jgi:hypothetical protein
MRWRCVWGYTCANDVTARDLAAWRRAVVARQGLRHLLPTRAVDRDRPRPDRTNCPRHAPGRRGRPGRARPATSSMTSPSWSRTRRRPSRCCPAMSSSPARRRGCPAPCACASPRPRPAIRTSARHTCRCSTSPSRASRAGGSCCASRTPIARASARTASSRSSTRSWLGLTWDEGPDIGGPVRALSPVRAARHLPALCREAARRRARLSLLVLAGTAHADARASSRSQAADRLRPALPRQDPRRSGPRCPGSPRRPVVRMLIPDDVELDLRRPHPRTRSRRPARRPGHPQGRRLPDLSPRRRRRRPRDGHHARRARRGVDLLDAQAPAALPLARPRRRRSSRTCRCCATPTSPRSPSARTRPPADLVPEQGYLPEALVNFLALLAYPPAGTPTAMSVEVFSFDEFSRDFDWARSTRSGRSSTSRSSTGSTASTSAS